MGSPAHKNFPKEKSPLQDSSVNAVPSLSADVYTSVFLLYPATQEPDWSKAEQPVCPHPKNHLDSNLLIRDRDGLESCKNQCCKTMSFKNKLTSWSCPPGRAKPDSNWNPHPEGHCAETLLLFTAFHTTALCNQTVLATGRSFLHSPQKQQSPQLQKAMWGYHISICAESEMGIKVKQAAWITLCLRRALSHCSCARIWALQIRCEYMPSKV